MSNRLGRRVFSGRPAGLVSAISVAVLAGGIGLAIRAGEDSRAEAPAEAAAPGESFPASPCTPGESLEHLELHPGLRIELVAAEPVVVDPIAIAFDEDGRMWVVEMRDYPHGPAEGESPQSRILILEDRTGDGRYETSTTFAEGLLFPTGLLPWRGGAIVTLAGEVAWFADTTGDGRADHRETWFTGFAQDNPQLRANRPTLALDNHIYVANGLRGGDVIARKPEWSEGAQPVSISGMDFRFHPFDGSYEAVSGLGQFGVAFDDFGRRFVCSNRNPCRHVVLEGRYLRRNPRLAVPAVMHEASPDGDDSRVYAISRAWTTSTLHAGQFTAACGLTIYRGDALPPEFRGNSFTCEPTGNLVHRDVLIPQGGTFTSRPGREGVEFLASRDEWFRPVNLTQGPDGALYVVDMYRAVIEHPEYMPQELRTRADLREGDRHGRIYRIVAAAGPPPRDQPRLSEASTAELVALLGHANAWHRETAARLLFERQDASAREPLARLVRAGATPIARTQALWALEGQGGLTADLVLEALADADPRVREQAVLLAEPRLPEDARLRERLIGLAADFSEAHDPRGGRFGFQLALTLGGVAESAAVEAIAAIAVRQAMDRWTRTAAASASPEATAPLLAYALRHAAESEQWEQPGLADLVGELAEVVGTGQDAEEIGAALNRLGRLAPAAADSPHALRVLMAGLGGLGRGTERRGQPLAARLDSLSDAERAGVLGIFQKAAALAGAADAEAALRREAIGVLRHAGYADAGETLARLVQSEAVQPVRLAAIQAVSRFAEPEIADLLLADFTAQTPTVRRAILDALLANPDRTRRLLEEIEAGEMAAAELDAARVARLTRHQAADIREKAGALLAAAAEDREQVLEEYRPALSLTANAERGREVFAKHCTTCHRIDGMGVDVAPDIADSRTKTPEQLLTDILDPNRAIDSNYYSYTVVTRDGQVLTGIIDAETDTSITLRQPEGKTDVVLREDVEELRSNGVSLMPTGLEQAIPLQAMADLISFIKNWRYLDGRVPIDVE